MNDTSEQTTGSAEKPALDSQAQERLGLLLGVMKMWRTRVEALKLVPETDDYMAMQNEYWLGACVTANALGKPFSPLIYIYALAGRDILTLESKLQDIYEERTRT
jgi:hypothetical protein